MKYYVATDDTGRVVCASKLEYPQPGQEIIDIPDEGYPTDYIITPDGPVYSPVPIDDNISADEAISILIGGAT